MKRFVMAAILVSTVATVGGARAAGPCAGAGSYDYATVTFKAVDNHTLTAELKEFGNALLGAEYVCADGSAHSNDLQSTLTLKVDGATVCTRAITSAPMDPFVFGANSHSLSHGTCGGNLDWGTFKYASAAPPVNLPFVPDKLPAGTDGSIAYAPVYTWVVPVAGDYWGLAGTADAGVPEGVYGVISHGVGVEAPDA